MKELKLHAEGHKEYLKQLKINFNKNVKTIKQNTSLSDKEKQTTISKLRMKYLREKQQSRSSLF